MGLYCSDVSGAFDRVHKGRLLRKLEKKGLGGQLLRVLDSWLETRTAQVVVEGVRSSKAELANQVFQGTVWGPPLWNVFFEDAREPVNKAGFLDAFFADDLNCYKMYHKSCQNKVVYEELAGCQKELHKWGAANRVQFDATKEHLHVLDRHTPEGEGFELLGVDFDEKLTMQKEVDELANRCHWKLRTLLRSKRFFTTPQLVQQYKSHVLPFLEHSTPALYHATDTLLQTLDRVQKTFLRRVGLTEEEALKNYNLAPLSTRRDVAMLGVVHRSVLGKGPPSFQKWFFSAKRDCAYLTRSCKKKHSRQLHDYLDGTHTALLRRSALGLPRVYNQLPESVVSCKTVKTFQRALQNLVKEAAAKEEENWSTYLSPRKKFY